MRADVTNFAGTSCGDAAEMRDEPCDDERDAASAQRAGADDGDDDGCPSARPCGAFAAGRASHALPHGACADAEPHDEPPCDDADGERPLPREHDDDATRGGASSDGCPCERRDGDGSVAPSSPRPSPCADDDAWGLRPERLRAHADADDAGRQPEQRLDDGDAWGLRRELRRAPCGACAARRLIL